MKKKPSAQAKPTRDPMRRSTPSKHTRPAAGAAASSKRKSAARAAPRSVSLPKSTAHSAVSAPAVQRRELYPAIEPYSRGYLRVSELHELYFEESGNPAGKAALFLHGGPGAGSDKRARQFFDPRHYRIVVFDQRGCGRSRPNASLEDNTTWALIGPGS